jgi:hypothetical protein
MQSAHLFWSLKRNVGSNLRRSLKWCLRTSKCRRSLLANSRLNLRVRHCHWSLTWRSLRKGIGQRMERSQFPSWSRFQKRSQMRWRLSRSSTSLSSITDDRFIGSWAWGQLSWEATLIRGMSFWHRATKCSCLCCSMIMLKLATRMCFRLLRYQFKTCNNTWSRW